MGKETIPLIEESELTVRELIIDAQRWMRYLWSRRWILLVSGLLGGVAGLCYSLFKAPVYTATTTFVVESADPKSRLGGLAGMAAMAGIDLGGGGGGLFQGDNILELYKSRTMIVQTLLSKVYPDSSELLIERYLTFTGIKEGWGDRPDLLGLDFRQDPDVLEATTIRLRDSVMTLIANTIRKGALTVDKPDKKLSIFQVEVTSQDEVFAKVFNDNLVRRVNDFYVQTKTKKSLENIKMFENKVDSVRNIMTGAIYSAARVADATPNLNPTRQVQRSAPAQEAQFSAEANKAILSQLLQNLELAKMNLMQEQPLIQFVDQPVYPLYVEQTGKAKGIIFGGLLVGFLTALFLALRRWYRTAIIEDQITCSVAEKHLQKENR